MSKHIQQISHYPPHERIKMFLIKRNKSHSNLTEDSAQLRLEAEVVEEGAKASRIIMWILYLCHCQKFEQRGGQDVDFCSVRSYK